MLFDKYLKEISKNNVLLLKPLKKGNLIQNPVIFWYKKITNLKEYRYVYLWKLYKQKLKLEVIFNSIIKNRKKLWDENYYILKNEIKFIYKKIDFLKNVYDFEAHKLDPKYEISYPDFNYDYYNKKFFWVTTKDIWKNLKIVSKEEKTRLFDKAYIVELLDYTKELVPWFKYKFWDFVFMSHNAGVLCIPDKKKYSLREIITLFFHEMTHFFRRYNTIKNFWTNYGFSDYMIIEEWFALYNEYHFWKSLIPNIVYNPYYDVCYDILMDNSHSEKEKKELIYKTLKEKWFSREKSLSYYYRFHRYSSFWEKWFFLKDLIYTKWYRKIKKMIKADKSNYSIIASSRIWPDCIKKWLYKTENSYDVKNYFELMLKKIKEKIWN